jgi:hypothetical protein
MTRSQMVWLQRVERARDARKRAVQDGKPALAIAKAMRLEVTTLLDAIKSIEFDTEEVAS